ncbi:flagellar filament capping protein FliD [bacterium]|nr:flagellar filament capping protein FliD [bacterium]
MVTSIQLGQFYQSGGKTLLGGSATGFDTQSLVESLVKARQIPVDTLTGKVDTNSKKLTALDQLNGLMSSFKTSLNFLRNPPGLSTASQDVFQSRTVNSSTNTGVSADSYVSITAAAGADQTSYSVTVQDIARRTIQTTNTISVADADTSIVAASATPGQFTAGALELKSGVTVNITAGDSLNDIAAKINATTDTSGVKAQVVKVGNGSYRLQMQSTQTGVVNAFDSDVAANTGAGGVLESIGLDAAASQGATDAAITVNGVAVTSASNTISDAIADVTFTVKQATPPGTNINAEVTADTSLLETAVTNFVNAYNEIRVFMAKQNQRGDDGLPTEDAVLSNNSTLRTIMTQIDSELNRTVSGLTSGLSRLSEIGVTFTDFAGDSETPAVRNVLQLDSDVFKQAVANNYDAVRRVLAFDSTTSSTDLIVSGRSNAATINDFSVVIDTVAQTATANYTDEFGVPQSLALTYSPYAGGANISGVDGTVLEGLKMVYANTVDATIDVHMTQGIADRLYNVADNITNSTSGLIATEKDGLTSQNDRYNTDIDRLNEQIEKYRQQLLARFSQLEQAIANVNTLLQSLDAQSNAYNNQ